MAEVKAEEEVKTVDLVKEIENIDEAEEDTDSRMLLSLNVDQKVTTPDIYRILTSQTYSLYLNIIWNKMKQKGCQQEKW